MPTKVEELFAAALELPPVERSQLAEELLDSLRTPEEVEVARLWMEEAERRLDEVESGQVQTISLEEALAHARAVLNDAGRASSRR